MKKRLRTLLGILAIVISIFTIIASAQRSAEAERRNKLAAALDKPDGLHEAAKMNGGVFHRSQGSYGIVSFFPLEKLAENSEIAIVGAPLSSENKLIYNGRNIVTEYKVKVQEPIEGKVRWDDVVTVDLPGGRIVFDDGTIAQVDFPEFPRLLPGHRYLLYLAAPETLKDYQPFGGPEGVFELKADDKVQPFADQTHSSAASVNEDVSEFLDRARVAAGRQKRK